MDNTFCGGDRPFLEAGGSGANMEKSIAIAEGMDAAEVAEALHGLDAVVTIRFSEFDMTAQGRVVDGVREGVWEISTPVGRRLQAT